MEPNDAAELVGTPLHRFSTMRRLRISLTQAWTAKRLLKAEERAAMLLNPAMFRWVQEGEAVDDDGLTRNGIFFLGTVEELEAMAEELGADDNMWPGYHDVQDREDKKVGISKADKKSRRHLPEGGEISLVRYEVKGRLRMRRRTTLPCDEDFFERAGYHIPHPELMVFEYRLYPDFPRNKRDEYVAAMEALETQMREALGAEVVPLPLGPVHPPGIFQPVEMEAAQAAEAAEQAEAEAALGRGRGHGRG